LLIKSDIVSINNAARKKRVLISKRGWETFSPNFVATEPEPQSAAKSKPANIFFISNFYCLQNSWFA